MYHTLWMKLTYFVLWYRISKAAKNWSAQFIDTEVMAAVDKYFPLWKVPNLTYLYLEENCNNKNNNVFILLTVKVMNYC